MGAEVRHKNKGKQCTNKKKQKKKKVVPGKQMLLGHEVEKPGTNRWLRTTGEGVWWVIIQNKRQPNAMYHHRQMARCGNGGI